MSSTKQDLQNRVADYLRYTRYARWAVISIVLLCLYIVPGLPIIPILGIAVGAIGYTLLCIVGEQRNWHLITNRPLILAVDTISAVALVVLSGGDNSVFLPILLFMVVSSAYWYGATAALVVILVQAILEIFGNWIYSGSTLPEWSFPVRLMIFAVVGLYLSWLTKSERLERDQLLAITTETEQQRQQLLALINTMTDAVIVSDTQGKILLHNSATSTYIDSAKIVNGVYVDGLLKFTDAQDKFVRIKLKSIDSALERRDLKLMISDGSVINAMLSITPYIVDRKSKGFIYIIRDITREHTIEQERLEFIAVAQHELRTPLTVAEGSLSTLMDPEYQPKDPVALEMLQMGFRSLRQISHIVTDLTTLSKAQNEQLDPDVESIQIQELFDEIIAEYSAEATKKNLVLTSQVSDKLQPIITSRYLVYEIVSNFITNALKFTQKGSIELIAIPRERDGGVKISVKDTGSGISTGDQKNIFKKFFQSENWQTRNHGGTGLGLYISQKLARRLTGEVSFQSKLSKGSTFTLELPAYSQHSKDQTKVAKAETKDFFKYL